MRIFLSSKTAVDLGPRIACSARNRWRSLVGAPRDLAGQVAVIAGWGPIARTLAGWLQAIGLEVVVVRNSPRPAGEFATFTYERLGEAARRADWPVIACPPLGSDRAMADRHVLGALPAVAHLVNVGRGEVVVAGAP